MLLLVLTASFSPQALKCEKASDFLTLFSDNATQIIAAQALSKLTAPVEYRQGGHIFPLELPLAHDCLSKIGPTSRILDVGPGYPYFSILCLLRGALKVCIVDHQDNFAYKFDQTLKDFQQQCQNYISDQKIWPEGLRGKMSEDVRSIFDKILKFDRYVVFPLDQKNACEYLKEETPLRFDLIVARNFLHFFPAEEQKKIGERFNDLLQENGIVYISVDSTYVPGLVHGNIAKELTTYQNWQVISSSGDTVQNIFLPVSEKVDPTKKHVLGPILLENDSVNYHQFFADQENAPVSQDKGQVDLAICQLTKSLRTQKNQLGWVISGKLMYSLSTISNIFQSSLAFLCAVKCMAIVGHDRYPVGYIGATPEQKGEFHKVIAMFGKKLHPHNYL